MLFSKDRDGRCKDREGRCKFIRRTCLKREAVIRLALYLNQSLDIASVAQDDQPFLGSSLHKGGSDPLQFSQVQYDHYLNTLAYKDSAKAWTTDH